MVKQFFKKLEKLGLGAEGTNPEAGGTAGE